MSRGIRAGSCSSATSGWYPSGVDGQRLAFAAPPLLRSGPVAAEDLTELIRFLGVAASDVLDAQWVDNGPGWVGVLLRDAATVLAVRPTPPCRLRDVGIIGTYPPGAESDVEVRALFAVGDSLAEDPVTGSLNASLAQWLIGTGRLPSAYVASQGTVLGPARAGARERGGLAGVGGRPRVLRGVGHDRALILMKLVPVVFVLAPLLALGLWLAALYENDRFAHHSALADARILDSDLGCLGAYGQSELDRGRLAERDHLRDRVRLRRRDARHQRPASL